MTVHGRRRIDQQASSVLIVPGSLAPATAWGPAAQALSSRREVFVLDRRGYGKSEDHARHQLADDVEDVCWALEETGADVLVGHSYGGVVSLHVASTIELDALVLFEPAFPIGAPIAGAGLERLRSLLSAGELSKALAYGLGQFVGLDESEVEARTRLDIWKVMCAHVDKWPRELAALDAQIGVPLPGAPLARHVSIYAGTRTHPRFKLAAEAAADACSTQVTWLQGEGHSTFLATPLRAAEAISADL